MTGTAAIPSPHSIITVMAIEKIWIEFPAIHIMNAFIGISRSQTTSLAVVAPGIAEALLATAIGLVAAIPAVVIYNLFARAAAAHKARLADAAAETMRLLSRDLDRGGAHLRRAAE